jgi:hypothetical protein
MFRSGGVYPIHPALGRAGAAPWAGAPAARTVIMPGVMADNLDRSRQALVDALATLARAKQVGASLAEPLCFDERLGGYRRWSGDRSAIPPEARTAAELGEAVHVDLPGALFVPDGRGGWVPWRGERPAT